MKKINGISFTLIIWCLTLLTAPLLYYVTAIIFYDKNFIHAVDSFFYFYSVFVLFGLLFSLPAYVVNVLVFHLTTLKSKNILKLRLSYVTMAIILVVSTFEIFLFKMKLHKPDLFYLMLSSYVLPVITLPFLINPLPQPDEE